MGFRARLVVGVESIALCILVAVGAAQGPPPAAPREQLVTGGRSPDGRFEVKIAEANRDPSNYELHVVDASSGKLLKVLPSTGGYFRYPEAVTTIKVLWHANGKFVAVTDAGTQHSRELYLFEVRSNDVVTLSIPDYAQNALGRVNKTALGGTAGTVPRAWRGDLLECTLTFNAKAPPRQGGKTPLYEVPFVLRVTYGPTTAPWVELYSMGRPAPR